MLDALLATDWFVPVRPIAAGYARGPGWKIQSTELLARIADVRAVAAADAPATA